MKRAAFGFLVSCSALQAGAATPVERVYFGTYTGKTGSQGIYVASFDAATGRVGEPRLAARSENPSFLARHPTRPVLYAVNEVGRFDGEDAGALTAFAVDPATGLLRALSQVSSRGADPCHLAVDRGGRHVLVANYTGGSVASFPIRADGGVEPASSFIQHRGSSANPERQEGPHGHMIETDPANRHVLAADLGLDKVLVYRFDAGTGALSPAEPPSVAVAPGAGPRHFAFAPDGRHLYLFNELTMTVTAYGYDDGRLAEVQTLSSLPPGQVVGKGDSGAEIVVHPGGRFVYTSNRGVDTLAVFARDPDTGRLTLVEHVPSGGKTPRSFGIDPGGRWLLSLHQRSAADQVVVFRIDPASGKLTPTGQVVTVPAAVSVVFTGVGGS